MLDRQREGGICKVLGGDGWGGRAVKGSSAIVRHCFCEIVREQLVARQMQN